MIRLRHIVDLMLEVAISRASLGRRSFVRMPAADGLFTLHTNATTIIQSRGGLEKATWSLKSSPVHLQHQPQAATSMAAADRAPKASPQS